MALKTKVQEVSSILFENCLADRVLPLTPAGVNILILDKANIWTAAGEFDPEVLASRAKWVEVLGPLLCST